MAINAIIVEIALNFVIAQFFSGSSNEIIVFMLEIVNISISLQLPAAQQQENEFFFVIENKFFVFSVKSGCEC